jgi:hypothetical protein
LIWVAGHVTPGAHKLEELRENLALFDLPPDLTGKRVLDIGCWGRLLQL